MLGERFGNYVVTDLIGEGGMGVVYLAEHPELGRRAAVKVLKAESAIRSDGVARFFNEARAANAVGHSGIVTIFDYGLRRDGSPYLLMEALQGESLAASLRRARVLPLSLAVEIARQVAQAMGAAHQAGIIHRDLKPENLFITRADERTERIQIKVLDFGIAKLQPRDVPPTLSLTQSGTVLGTPLYMSPEQCRGTGRVDCRSDIYALGAILFEMLTGHPPFESSGFGELVHMHISQPPPPLRCLRPDAPSSLEDLLSSMLAKDRDQRIQTMDELVRRLDALVLPHSSTIAFADEAASSLPTQPTVAIASARPLGSAATANPSAKHRHILGPKRSSSGARKAWSAPVLTPVMVALLVTTLSIAARPDVPTSRASTEVEARSERHTSANHEAAHLARSTEVASVAPPATPASAPPAPASSVELRVISVPSGASVWDTQLDRLLGTTPLNLTRQRSQASLALRIAKRGYASMRATLTLDRDREIVAPLSAWQGAPRSLGPSAPKTSASPISTEVVPEARPEPAPSALPSPAPTHRAPPKI